MLQGKNEQILYKTLSILVFVIFVGFCIYAYKMGLLTSTEAISDTIVKFGVIGPLVFILLQVIQVIIPFIPCAVGCYAGVMIFGAEWGFVYNYIAIVIGSLIAFLIARRYGKPFLEKMSPKMYDKYSSWLEKDKHFDKMFAAAIFLPFAPDDFLCMLAGITKITWKKFLIIIIIFKPWVVILYSVGETGISSFFS